MSTIVTNPYDDIGARFATSASRQDVGIGVILPFGRAEDGVFFKQSFTTIEAAKSNIKNLVLTMRGERLMHPSLGTQLWRLIMEPMSNDDLGTQIELSIRENVRTWLQYINIDEIKVVMQEENNTIEISMNISLKNDPQTKERMFFSISRGDV
jgi:phage baseplate assembly protein W